MNEPNKSVEPPSTEDFERMKLDRDRWREEAHALGWRPGMTIVDSAHDRAIIQACARLLMGAALDLLDADPHQWSTRPCSTCSTISGLVGRKFGCVAFAERRAKT